MNFIVIFVSMLIERFFDWSHVRDWGWFMPYLRYMHRYFPKSPFGAIAAAVLPVTIAVILADYLLAGWLYGFLSLLLNIFILIYCFGPQSLWADSFSSINTLKEGDIQFGAEKLNLAFNAISANDIQAQHHSLLNSIFIAADRRVFAVVFWFVLLGPAGAILYRMIALPFDVHKKNVPEEQLVMARSLEQIEAIMNWLPARIFSLLLALGGHFKQVFAQWKRLAWQGIHGNDEIITECGRSALGKTAQDLLPPDGSVERRAVGLIDRVFAITLIILFALSWLTFV